MFGKLKNHLKLIVFPQRFIFTSTFDRLHCHLQRTNDGCCLDERFPVQQITYIIRALNTVQSVQSIRKNKTVWKENINSFHHFDQQNIQKSLALYKHIDSKRQNRLFSKREVNRYSDTY